MNIELIKCTEQDLLVLKAISIETFTDTFGEQNTPENLSAYLATAYSSNKLLKELKNQESSFFFLRVDKKLAGYLKLNSGAAQTETKLDNALEVERIYIKKEFKRLGLGKYLIGKAIELAKKKQMNTVWLGVWEENQNARKFYEKMGFAYIDTHSFFLGEEEQTDLIMAKSLTD